MSAGVVCGNRPTRTSGTRTPAATLLPLTEVKESEEAFLSPEKLASTKAWAGAIGELSAIRRITASMARVTMFCPAASPV